MSACRNLAGRELNGRPLRIDSAMNAPGESFRANKGAYMYACDNENALDKERERERERERESVRGFAHPCIM